MGSRSLMPGGLPGWLSRHAQGLRLAAIAIAWSTLLGVILKPRIPVWAVVAAALVAGSLYAAAATDRWGPRPAVILKSCFTAAGELPAGTEVWVQPTDDERWLIAGSPDVSCPVDALELIFPH